LSVSDTVTGIDPRKEVTSRKWYNRSQITQKSWGGTPIIEQRRVRVATSQAGASGSISGGSIKKRLLLFRKKKRLCRHFCDEKFGCRGGVEGARVGWHTWGFRGKREGVVEFSNLSFYMREGERKSAEGKKLDLFIESAGECMGEERPYQD